MKNINLPTAILEETKSDTWTHLRSLHESRRNSPETIAFDVHEATRDDLVELKTISENLGFKKDVRVIDAVIESLYGETATLKVPSYEAFGVMLTQFIQEHAIESRLVEKQNDGTILPWVVTVIRPKEGRNDKPGIEMIGQALGVKGERLTHSWWFEPIDVVRKTIPQILDRYGLLLETTDLRATNEASVDRLFDLLEKGYGHQVRITGEPRKKAYHRGQNDEHVGNRAVLDIDASKAPETGVVIEVHLNGRRSEFVDATVPIHPIVPIFDLATHDDLQIHVDHLQDYVYRPELKEKLILPETQREMLDILTLESEVISDDLVEGKTAGNIVLSKGIPGVGKTLTAEIYAEVMGKPLYGVRAGNLGTTASSVSDALKTIFKRANRWGAVLLLDECDVFVMERGANIETNAVTAEFLRTLEYQQTMVFMTTNRGDAIDEAIVSRCAAIIHFDAPDADHARRLWSVMAENFKTDLPEEMISNLVDMFPGITGRDIKMLLRLALRVAEKRKQSLSEDIFRQCAVFRGIRTRREKCPGKRGDSS